MVCASIETAHKTNIILQHFIIEIVIVILLFLTTLPFALVSYDMIILMILDISCYIISS